jgi:TonB family protein
MKPSFMYPSLLPQIGLGLIGTMLISGGVMFAEVNADPTGIAFPGTIVRFDPDWQGTKYEPAEVVSKSCNFKIFPYVVLGEFGRVLMLQVQTCGHNIITVRDIELTIDGNAFHLPLEMNRHSQGEIRLDNQEDDSLRKLVLQIGKSSSARAVVGSDNGPLLYHFKRSDKEMFSRMWTIYTQEDLPRDEEGRAAWLKEPGPYFAGFRGVTEPKVIQSTRHLPAPPTGSDGIGHHQVILQIMVFKDGSVGEVNLLKTTAVSPEFAESAVTSVRKWRFEPPLRDKAPVDAYTTIVVEVP